MTVDELKIITDKEPVYDWVKPVKEPVLWICQPARSGGTLLLRLLDSHPQIHTYPSVFGFNNEKMIWPTSEELTGDAEALLNGSFDRMSLAKFHRIGLAKQSSNMPQEKYPVYFNNDWFRNIFLKWATENTERCRFNALFTAVFNSWQNYQGLYFEKKYVLGHTTLRRESVIDYTENFQRFQRAYPDGYFIFITRKPEDWMSSFVSLKNCTPYEGNPYDAIAYYKSYYHQAIDLINSNQFIILNFDDLIIKPESVLRKLAEILGIAWNPLLLTPTFNSAPWYPNSSFNLSRKAAIDKNVLGRGKDLSDEILLSIDDEMRNMYLELKAKSIIKS